MPSNQIFKAVYFPDHKEVNPKAKGLVLAFGEKNKDLYKTIANLESNELRNKLGTDSYVELEQRAKQEGLPVNTYCLWYLRKNLDSVLEKKEIKSKEKNDEDFDVESNKIICSDCISGLKSLPENSIDGCITDPPYNYEFIGHKWDNEEIKRRTERVKNSKTLIKHIPYGSGLAGGVRNDRWYQKNADNVLDYQNWSHEWGKEVFRVLKPGAYILVFNSTRTIAHVQVALEKAGFYARDIIVWRKNSGIPKGLNFVKKLEKEGVSDSKNWEGWHSCLRNEWEAIVMLQKPLTNNYLETVKKYGVGLLHAKGDGIDGFQSNILEDIKRDKKESFNIHCTIKPTDLIKKLIDLTIPPSKDKVVLDPFMGSGTTAVAAIEKGISYLGFEINKEYCDIANKRVEKHTRN